MTREELEKIRRPWNHNAYVNILVWHIMETVQATFDRIEKDKKEPFYEYYVKYSPKFVLDMFKRDMENGRPNLVLNVIPAEQYETLLKRYMSGPMTARIPDSVIMNWLSIIMRNICIIASCTKLYGRAMEFPAEAVKEAFPDMPECENFADVMDFLYNIKFYSWAMLSPYDHAMSDYGIEGVYKVLSEYNEIMEPEEKLILVNRCIDVMHDRGGIAHYFVEGGDETCERISGKSRKKRRLHYPGYQH